MGWRGALLRLLGLALIAFAAAAAWWRAPEQPAPVLVERWGMPPSRFMELDGRVVHLRDEGPLLDEQPLVLLHGLGGSLHDWEDWAQALRRTHRVIRVDLPGSGLSAPAADDDYRCETDARKVLALLDKLGVEHMRLVGQGRGGEVAAHAALLAPRRVRRLLLVAGAPQEAEAVPAPLRVASGLPLPPWFVNAVLPRPLLASALEQLWGDPVRLSDAQVDRRRDLLLIQGGRWALRQQWRQLGAEDEGEALFARLQLPVLLLWGTEDRLAPPAQAQALRSSIPGSQLLLLDGVGHLPQEEAPARSLAAALPFIDAP
jgi:pimeloyl-ACP methyl ester carboxylesterase